MVLPSAQRLNSSQTEASITFGAIVSLAGVLGEAPSFPPSSIAPQPDSLALGAIEQELYLVECC